MENFVYCRNFDSHSKNMRTTIDPSLRSEGWTKQGLLGPNLNLDPERRQAVRRGATWVGGFWDGRTEILLQRIQSLQLFS